MFRGVDGRESTIEHMSERKFGDPPELQNILNALPSRDRPQRNRVPVKARIMWEHDGEQWVTGHALRLDEVGNAVFVEFLDSRYRFTGAWLGQDDVIIDK